MSRVFDCLFCCKLSNNWANLQKWGDVHHRTTEAENGPHLPENVFCEGYILLQNKETMHVLALCNIFVIFAKMGLFFQGGIL